MDFSYNSLLIPIKICKYRKCSILLYTDCS
nr:MAG TPA: hypothetical protein [Caudoviricetes sp.]